MFRFLLLVALMLLLVACGGSSTPEPSSTATMVSAPTPLSTSTPIEVVDEIEIEELGMINVTRPGFDACTDEGEPKYNYGSRSPDFPAWVSAIMLRMSATHAVLWRVSNNTPEPKMVQLVSKTRDKDGFLISSGSFLSYSNQEDGIRIPPFTSVIVQDWVNRCPNVPKNSEKRVCVKGNYYCDADITMEVFAESFHTSGKFTGGMTSYSVDGNIVFENTGDDETSAAQVFVVAYDSEGVPIYGENRSEWMRIPPGEKVKVDLKSDLDLVLDFMNWETPEAAHWEVIISAVK